MLSSESAVEVSDTTKAECSARAGYKKMTYNL